METQDFSEHDLSLVSNLVDDDFSSVVVKEVDMDFLENPFYDEISGHHATGCQRISYCSCNCNQCCIFV